MHMMFSRAILLLLLVFTGPCLMAEPPRTLLINAGYHEMQSLQLNADAMRGFDHACRIRTLSASVLSEYGTVMLFAGGDLEATEAQVRAYLEAGGNVIVVGPAVRQYLPRWQGLFGPLARYGAVPGFGIEVSPHPVLAQQKAVSLDEELDAVLNAAAGGDGLLGDPGAGTAAAETERAAEMMDLPGGHQVMDWPATPIGDALEFAAGGVSPIRNDDFSCLWIKDVGAGKLIFLADVMCPSSLVESHWKFAVRTNDAFLSTLWTWLGVPTVEDVTTVPTPTWWWRDPGRSNSGARGLTPPRPTPAEAVETVSMLAGQDERERRTVYLSLPTTPKGVSVRLPRDGAVRWRVGVQDAPTSDYRGPLVYVRWLEPRETVVPTAPLLTWWIEADTTDLAPGEYRETLEVVVDDMVLPLPVAVTVAPVRLPKDHRYLVDFEHYVMNMLYDYGWQDSWPAEWSALGMDVVMGGNPSYPDVSEHVTTIDGRKLAEIAREAPQPLRETWPQLDFSRTASGRFDLMLQAALAENMTVFRTYDALGLQSRSFVELAKALYRDETLTEESPEVAATVRTYMRQAADFLRSKGMRSWYSKRMDEWGADGLEPYLSLARPIAEAGWLNMHNANVAAVLAKPELRARLYPYTTAIWVSGGKEAWDSLLREAPIPPRADGTPTGYMGMLTSSYWWDSPAAYGMRAVWASAWRRDLGFHLHGWGMRGTYAAAGIYPLPGWRRVCPNGGMLMTAEAMDDARYGVLLQEMIDAIRPTDAATADRLLADWHRIVSDTPDALLPVTSARVDAEATPNLASFYEARRRLFGLLEKARAQVPATPPTLTWQGHDLIAAGRPAMALAPADPSLAAAAATLQRALLARTGVALAAADTATATALPRLHLATVELARAHFPDRLSASYPAAGAYLFLDDAAGDVWLVARDVDTLSLAARTLVSVSHLSPRWHDAGTSPNPKEPPTP